MNAGAYREPVTIEKTGIPKMRSETRYLYGRNIIEDMPT